MSQPNQSYALNSRPRRHGGMTLLIHVCCTLLVGSLGCGDSRPTRVQVSGQVLIDGQPLKEGNIKFVPQGARPSSGRLDKDGNFTLTCYDGNDGVIPGQHQVQVSSFELVSASRVRWLAPPHYADFRTSGLRFEILESTDDLTIELTWNGGKPFIQ